MMASYGTVCCPTRASATLVRSSKLLLLLLLPPPPPCALYGFTVCSLPELKPQLQDE
jgi:hypothetical protein